jgi:hypothetical protein
MSRNTRAARRAAFAVLLGCTMAGVAGTASSATVQWTDWTSVSGNSATGTLPGATVTLSGPNDGGNTTGTFNWGPQSTYVGGVAGNAPCSGTASCLGDIVNLTGASPPATETLTFSSPVTNPIFAVWSLGQPTVEASLAFPTGTTPTIQSSGTNGVFGFTSLIASGNVVTGREGNGTFVLPGTYSSIPLTASLENFYGFTVGASGPISAAVPEPSIFALLAAGLMAAGCVGRRRRGIPAQA